MTEEAIEISEELASVMKKNCQTCAHGVMRGIKQNAKHCETCCHTSSGPANWAPCRSGESRDPDPDTGLIHAMAALAEADAHDTEAQALGQAIRHVEELLPPDITVVIESGSTTMAISDWDAEFDISDEDDQRRGEIIMSAHDLAERKTR